VFDKIPFPAELKLTPQFRLGEQIICDGGRGEEQKCEGDQGAHQKNMGGGAGKRKLLIPTHEIAEDGVGDKFSSHCRPPSFVDATMHPAPLVSNLESAI